MFYKKRNSFAISCIVGVLDKIVTPHAKTLGFLEDLPAQLVTETLFYIINW
jgi:hypothetical protein